MEGKVGILVTTVTPDFVSIKAGGWQGNEKSKVECCLFVDVIIL